MATIKEIADLAGVSRGTVDRVLNKRGSVNPQTAEKILEIAQALDYKPNRAGLVLAAQKKNLKLISDMPATTHKISSGNIGKSIIKRNKYLPFSILVFHLSADSFPTSQFKNFPPAFRPMKNIKTLPTIIAK